VDFTRLDPSVARIVFVLTINEAFEKNLNFGMLENANVVGTPGSGFGPSGEGYFRLTAFGTYENTLAAMERIQTL